MCVTTYFNGSFFFFSLDTIQHIESLSLLFNNYYSSFINIILKLSKNSLRSRSVVFYFFPSFLYFILVLLIRYASDVLYFLFIYFFFFFFFISVSLCLTVRYVCRFDRIILVYVR